MRNVKEAKYLFPIGLSCAALLAGCYSPDRESSYSYYESPGYTQSSEMATTDTAITRSYTQEQDQGATGSQTQTTTGSGEIQSERMVIPLYEEQVQVGRDTVESSTVRLRKEVTTETINQPVQIRRETIVVDREGAGGTGTSQQFQSGSGQSQQVQSGSQQGSLKQPFEQGEIVVRLHREEPVVEKRIVPAGNIIVETRADTEQVNVQQQVRRENIQVDKGNAQNVIISDNLNQPQSRTSVGATRPEPQRYDQEEPTRDTSTEIRSSESELQYRTPVTTREYEPFPRPQPDGRETFPELKKDPERRP